MCFASSNICNSDGRILWIIAEKTYDETRPASTADLCGIPSSMCHASYDPDTLALIRMWDSNLPKRIKILLVTANATASNVDLQSLHDAHSSMRQASSDPDSVASARMWRCLLRHLVALFLRIATIL